MNNTEINGLCRYVAAMCPAQKMDEATPDAWAHVLRDIRVEDARAAVIELAKRQQFIAPSEIRAEVKRIRARRLDAAVIEPPPEVADHPARYIGWLRGARQQVADGLVIEAPAIERGTKPDLRALLAKVGATPPESDAPGPISRENSPNPTDHPTPTTSIA